MRNLLQIRKTNLFSLYILYSPFQTPRTTLEDAFCALCAFCPFCAFCVFCGLISAQQGAVTFSLPQRRDAVGTGAAAAARVPERHARPLEEDKMTSDAERTASDMATMETLDGHPVPERSSHLPDLCNLVISSLLYDNLRNYLKFTFRRAILNSGGAPQ